MVLSVALKAKSAAICRSAFLELNEVINKNGLHRTKFDIQNVSKEQNYDQVRNFKKQAFDVSETDTK